MTLSKQLGQQQGQDDPDQLLETQDQHQGQLPGWKGWAWRAAEGLALIWVLFTVYLYHRQNGFVDLIKYVFSR